MDKGLTSDDFILQRDINGNITGGGYNIESMLLKKGIAPMRTLNGDEVQGGGNNNKNVSSLFTDLAVPAGLFYINQKVPKNVYDEDVDYREHTMLSDDIHDQLFELIEVDKKEKRKTKKHINKLNNRKTRRHMK